MLRQSLSGPDHIRQLATALKKARPNLLLCLVQMDSQIVVPFKLPLKVPLRVLQGSTLKGPCAHIVCTLALKYLYRDYFKAKVYIYYLGTWTLRERLLTIGFRRVRNSCLGFAMWGSAWFSGAQTKSYRDVLRSLFALVFMSVMYHR